MGGYFAIIQITGVRSQSTNNGLEVVLQTNQGELSQPTTKIDGNTLIADIKNAECDRGLILSLDSLPRADIELTVTAQKRLEEAQDIPLRATVIPQQEIEDAQRCDRKFYGVCIDVYH